MEIESGLCSNYKDIRCFILIYKQLVSVTDLLNSPLSAHQNIGVFMNCMVMAVRGVAGSFQEWRGGGGGGGGATERGRVWVSPLPR